MRTLPLVAAGMFFSAAALGGDALFWGNVGAGYAKLFTGLAPETARGDRPPIDDFARFRLVGIVHSGQSGLLLTDGEISRLREYVESGGTLLLDAGTPGFMRQGESSSDLSRAEALLGAKRYFYGGGIAPTTELAQAILGDLAEKGNIYSGDGRSPGLAQFSGMTPIYGNDDRIRLGVNRRGKGAVIYTAQRAGVNPDYDAVLAKLVETLLDPEKLDTHFPVPLGNNLAVVGGQATHLAVRAKDAAAAKLLTDTLERQSGQTDFAPGRADDEFTIHVGLTSYAESLGLDFESLHKFGYYMVLRDGRNLVLAGRNAQANRYAVMDFLKRHSGYRQFGHSRFTEVVPKLAALKLPDRLEAREEPSIHSYVTPWPANADFGRSSRITCSATHALSQLVPPGKYADTHPEYFPEINGQRVKVGERQGGPWNPCLANPDLPRLVREYAEEYFRKNPENLGLPLGVNDGAGDCQCAHCAAEFDRHGNQYANFYNMAARELAKTHPGKLVAMIAYSARATNVPRGIAMEPNILVQITGSSRSAFAEMPKWREAGIRRIGLYDYLYTSGGNGYVTPRHNPRLVAAAWRQAHAEYGLDAVWVELYPATSVFETARQYVLDELAWNIDVDIDALLRDYCVSMYGPASEPMEAFFGRLEDIHARRADPLFFYADRNKPEQFDPFTFADLEFLDARFAEAAKTVAADSGAAWRMGITRRYWELLRLHIAAALCARELSGAGAVTGEAEAARLVDLAETGYGNVLGIDRFTMTEEEEAAIFTKNNSLDKFRRQQYLNMAQLLDPAVDRAFDRIDTWLRGQNAREAVPDFWRRHAARGDGRFQGAVASRIWQTENSPENLIANPGFEPLDATDIPEGELARLEWSRLHPGLRGWSTWNFPNAVTRFYWDSREKRSGGYSAAIGENQITGTINAIVAVEPGCRYRFSAHVKRNHDRGGSFSIRFRADGKWMNEAGIIRENYPAESVGEWIEVSTVFTAPVLPEAAEKLTAMILLGAPAGQREGEMIWFDDVSLMKIGEAFSKKK